MVVIESDQSRDWIAFHHGGRWVARGETRTSGDGWKEKGGLGGLGCECRTSQLGSQKKADAMAAVVVGQVVEAADCTKGGLTGKRTSRSGMWV